jgi:hypothetical protein
LKDPQKHYTEKKGNSQQYKKQTMDGLYYKKEQNVTSHFKTDHKYKQIILFRRKIKYNCEWESNIFNVRNKNDDISIKLSVCFKIQFLNNKRKQKLKNNINNTH